MWRWNVHLVRPMNFSSFPYFLFFKNSMGVAPGVNCPASYYCPLYPPYVLQNPDVQTMLATNGCIYNNGTSNAGSKITGNSNYQVVCPCQPGYYCQEGTEQPIYCPQGHYCPPTSNTTTVQGHQIGSDGLGAWGGKVMQSVGLDS